MRNLQEVKYIPLLSVRPAELRAMKELPNKSKDAIFPYFTLRPWASALHLDSVLKKVEESYPRRPIIVDAGIIDPTQAGNRPVHSELQSLRNPLDGYRNWFEFLEARQNFIPALQLSHPDELSQQIELLASLGRGIAVRFPSELFGTAPEVVETIADFMAGEQICVILDFEQASRLLLNQTLSTVTAINNVVARVPTCSVCVSASSFPADFVGRTEQDIYERRLFDEVRRHLPNLNLIYSDRGSARAERQTGGGGAPAPRVDLATMGQWGFFREVDVEDRDQAYFDAAKRAIDSDFWDENLHVWGTQMVQRTAAEDNTAIVSPARSTAVRINIHLQQQLYHDDPGAKYDTDEDWSDYL